MVPIPLLFFFFFFFFLFVITYPPSVCGNAELKVLMEMKASLDPENRFLASWTEEGDPCSDSFQGVACNEHGKVANISLQGKGLSGRIPPAVSGLKCLSGLFLHYNYLKGEIPKEISNLTELSDLYLNFNNLSGSIPAEIGSMVSLQVLQLCHNQLSGSIPATLGSLKKLSFLELQWNQLTGAIPVNLGDLSALSRLDLSFNRLFGSIPRKLADIPHLEFLDVSNNTLSGNVTLALKSLNQGFRYGNNSALCGVGFASLIACAPSDTNNPNRPEPIGTDPSSVRTKDIPQSADVAMNCNKAHCPSSSKTAKIAIVVGVIAVVTGGTIACLFAFTWYRRRKQKIGSTYEASDSRLSTDQTKDFSRKSMSPLVSLEYSNGWDPLAKGQSTGGPSQEILQGFTFNLEEVESATQYFSDVNLLGKSSFSATYRGILQDGSSVAVKSINMTSCKLEEADFLKGLKMLTSLRHENLVALRGFCCSIGRGECFLIYQFIANGSLLHYLDVKDDDEKVLDWATRISIINGIAKGIAYLHSDKPNKPVLVHQNISAEKILIDHHFNPLISDSGLHKLLVDDVVFSTLKGSAAMGYLAPEYATVGRFTEKSDVYAFGVIVLQILSGKRRIAHSMRLEAESGKLNDLIDQNLQGKYFEHEAGNLVKIALICTNDTPDRRPTMEIVIDELNKCTSRF